VQAHTLRAEKDLDFTKTVFSRLWSGSGFAILLDSIFLTVRGKSSVYGDRANKGCTL
jgi:hypothetical protein